MAGAAAAAVIIGGAISAFGTLEKVEAEKQSNAARQEAIDDRIQQERLASNQRIVQRQIQVQRLLSKQQAQFGASGFQPTSASFVAIQSDTFNQYARDLNAENLNLEMKETQLREESENYDKAENIGIANDIFEGAHAIYDSTYRSYNFAGSNRNTNWDEGI